ncbi:MAG TPA: hypothetical protein VGR49_07665 [Actinomycetota bacterium]|nr:hypothetical protein [Actinomycetota bacterium]
MRIGAGRVLVLGPVLLAATTLLVQPASAQAFRPEVDRQVIVFLLDRVSFEELLAAPAIRALARAGGAALLSPLTVPGDDGPGAYLTLGAGTRSAGPDPRVLAFDATEPVEGDTRAIEIYEKRYPQRDPPSGPFLLEIEPYVRANEGRSVPGLLGRVLAEADRTVAVYGNADFGAGRHRPAVLVGMDGRGEVNRGRVGQAFLPVAPGDPPLLLPLDEPAPDEIGGYRTDFDVLSFVALGNRFPNPSPYLSAHLTVFDMGDTLRIDEGASEASAAAVAAARREALGRIGDHVERLVGRAAAHDVLVIVVGPSTSGAMDTAKDMVTPIVVARGDPLELFPEEGPLGILTSATTRRDGVVSNEDVAPTILDFFRLRISADMRGSPITRVEGAAPFELHARHLANRRMTVPIQAGAGAYAALAGLLGVVLAARPDRGPRWLRHAAAWLALSPLPLAAALLLAGHLPRLTYTVVVPFIVAAAAVGTLFPLPLRRNGPVAAPAAIGAVLLAALAVEAAFGWTAALTPFLGGSELDGVRFYGLPNVFIGLLLGGGLWAAAFLPTVAGFALLVALALFAGLPWTGANIGAAVTLFTAAGLWLGLRRRGGLGWREVALAAAVVIGGMAVVLAFHALPAGPTTHATRFLRGPARTPAGILSTLASRLAIGVRMVAQNPLALIPALGIGACLAVVLRPPAAIRGSLERYGAWRDALLVILLASAVAYVANDTGPSAAGLGFAAGLGGLLWVTLTHEAAPASPAIPPAPPPPMPPAPPEVTPG